MNVTQGELKGAALRPGAEAEPQVRQPTAVYTADTASGPDHLGHAARAAFLAEVVAHRSAGTPLTIGIFGPAGSGKSSFLASLLSGVEAIDRGATEAGLATPFHAGMAVARVTAEPGVPASRALTAAVGSLLARIHPRLLDAAAHAGLDSRAVARQAADDLAAARAQLDGERQALDALAGRQARLADTVLFDTDGSGVDTYVRGNRGRIERRMRAFGAGNDPIGSFKVQVRDAHETSAPWAQGMGWLRAFYAYRGQGRLLVLAVALLLASWGLGVLSERQSNVIATIQSGGDKMTGFADWLAAQWHWLTPTRDLLDLGALAALAANLLRGFAFLLPVRRGVGLLRHELDSRRREFDSRLAHQTRRVDTLSREVERLSRRAADAESRLPSGETTIPSPASMLPAADDDGRSAAQAFFATLSDALNRAASASPGSTTGAPTRLVIGLDGLDRLSSPEAAAFIESAAVLLARPGVALVFAADRSHLATGLSETDPALASEKLARIVQLPINLAPDEIWGGQTAYARALLDESTDGDASAPQVDPALSGLDRPWTSAETAVLQAVAPLAGTTPRAVKRLVNLYRVARADPLMADADPKSLAALALGLALQTQGLPPDMARGPVQGEGAGEIFDARRAIGAALGLPFGALDGQRGTEVARAYSVGR